MTSKKKNTKQKFNKNIKNGLDRISDNFKELFILLISILHGELFFIISGHSLEIIDNFNIVQLSKIVLFYSVFFRIFQTQLLAALKYDKVWKVRIYDFIIVFLTVLFEFLFFNILYKESFPFIKGYAFMVLFALFGIFGYAHTFFAYKRGTNKQELVEKKIQQINIWILLIILCLVIMTLLMPSYILIIIVNFIIAMLLILNIYFSLTISSDKMNFFKKRTGNSN